jgi:hypothetical protein
LMLARKSARVVRSPSTFRNETGVNLRTTAS